METVACCTGTELWYKKVCNCIYLAFPNRLSCITKTERLIPGALPTSTISPLDAHDTKARKKTEKRREARTPSQTRGPKGIIN